MLYSLSLRRSQLVDVNNGVLLTWPDLFDWTVIPLGSTVSAVFLSSLLPAVCDLWSEVCERVDE